MGERGLKALQRRKRKIGVLGVKFLTRDDCKEFLDAIATLNLKMDSFKEKFIEGLYVTRE